MSITPYGAPELYSESGEDTEAVASATSAPSPTGPVAQSPAGQTVAMQEAFAELELDAAETKGTRRAKKRKMERGSSSEFEVSVEHPKKLSRVPGPARQPSSVCLVPFDTLVQLQDGMGQDFYRFAAMELYSGDVYSLRGAFPVYMVSFATLCHVINEYRTFEGLPRQDIPLNIEYWDSERAEPGRIYQSGGLWHAIRQQLALPGQPEIVLRCRLRPEDTASWSDMGADFRVDEEALDDPQHAHAFDDEALDSLQDGGTGGTAVKATDDEQEVEPNPPFE